MCIRDRTYIVNYHPAFANTLLGLRLFQLDMLIMDNSAVDLPKKDDEYILGAGETAPDIMANEAASDAFLRAIEPLQDESGMIFRSYVICDYEQMIAFSPHEGVLELTGTPFFYCWRFASDTESYSEDQSRQDIVARLHRKLHEAERAEGAAYDVRTNIIAALLDKLEEYDQGYSLFESGPIFEMLALDDRGARQSYAEEYSTESLKKALIDLTFVMEKERPVYLKEISEGISAQHQLLRNINPAVWDAGVTTMRTVAFFRFCRERFPDQWDSFFSRVQDIGDPKPVPTPTVMYNDAAYERERE